MTATKMVDGYDWYADASIPAYWRDIQSRQYSEADYRKMGLWESLSEQDKEFVRFGDMNSQKPNDMLIEFMKHN